MRLMGKATADIYRLRGSVRRVIPNIGKTGLILPLVDVKRG